MLGPDLANANSGNVAAADCGVTDSGSKPDSVTDPAGKTTTFEYFAGDLVEVRDPLGHETRIFVDNAGRPVAVTDPTGRRTRRHYDDGNQLAKITDPAGHATLFEHDGNGNLTKVTDARAVDTTMTYDSMNRLITRVDGLNRTEQLEYDQNGNLTKQTDRKGAGHGARLRRAQPADVRRLRRDGSPASYAGTTEYVYDGANRPTGITQGAATVALGYDTAGRRSSVTLPNGVSQSYAGSHAQSPLSQRGGRRFRGQCATSRPR